MLPTKVRFLKIQRPSGFFLMFFELMSSMRFTLFGLLAVLAGMAFAHLPVLGWTIGASDLCLSIGFAMLIASYLRMSLGSSGSIRIFGVVLLVPLVCLFLAHQGSAQAVKGQLQVSDGPVESVNVRRGGIAVAHHLGAPLKLTEADGGSIELAYGFEDAQVVPLPEASRRQALGSWFVESLGLTFRDASLKATVSVQHQDGQWAQHSFRQGDVYTVSDRLSLRLATLGYMSSGEGYRLMFEIIKDGERSMRTVYEQLPNLDVRLGLALPQIRVDAVSRTPAHQLYVYARNQSPFFYGFLGAGALALLLGAVRRVS
jgi:hypothetical protein